MLQRLIAKSIKNSSSSIRRYYALESSSSFVGKSINSNNNRIITEDFQQRRRFRSTSPFLSNYPNKSSNFGQWTTVRSFSSSGASTGVDEISKELAVPYVEHLITTVLPCVGSSLFWMYLTLYFSPRFLKFMHATMPSAVSYEDSFYRKMEVPIDVVVNYFACVSILNAIDPAILSEDSIKSVLAFSFVFVTLMVIVALVDLLVEMVKIRRNLPFSVGDTIKMGNGIGYYLEGKVEAIGQFSLIRLTNEKSSRIFLRYSSLSSKVIVRSIVQTIPLKIHDVDKISRISEEIIKMMMLDPNVSLDMGHPYCNCSQESSYAKLTLGYDVKNKKSEKYVLRNAVQIIKEHGGELIK